LRVVCDSTVLIGLAKIGKLDLLKQIYEEVYIPEAVYTEVVSRGKGKPGVREIANALWIKKEPVKERRTVDLLIAEMGYGEAEVLVLSKELNADWLLVDDERARAAAISAGFNIIGLAGILLLAKQLKLIPSIKPLFDELRNKNFRISDKICKQILKKAGEE
jgi:predicted nucleic acid-binding protein